jgi:hypothetical protein
MLPASVANEEQIQRDAFSTESYAEAWGFLSNGTGQLDITIYPN